MKVYLYSGMQNLIEKSGVGRAFHIAIRTVLDYEIQTNKENVVLAQVVEVLLNRNEEFTDEEREKISESVETIAATASGGIMGASLSAVTASLLGGV